MCHTDCLWWELARAELRISVPFTVKGEPLKTVSAQSGITAVVLSGWPRVTRLGEVRNGVRKRSPQWSKHFPWIISFILSNSPLRRKWYYPIFQMEKLRLWEDR